MDQLISSASPGLVDRDAPLGIAQHADHAPALRARRERAPRPTERRRTTTGGPSLAHMVHELRTPIHAVLGYATLLRDGTGGDLPPRAAEMVGRIAWNAEQLRDLVNDFLELARLDAAEVRVTVEAVSLSRLLHEVVATLEPQARAKGIELALLAPDVPDVWTDARRVRQIVLNLVANAVKFTDVGGTVTLALEPHSSGIAVRVVDTGIGIAAADAERVFGEFVQVGAAHGGTGLGLAISRQLARLLGGDIALRSEPGVGSCFTLTLPRSSSHQPADDAHDPLAHDGRFSGPARRSTSDASRRRRPTREETD